MPCTENTQRESTEALPVSLQSSAGSNARLAATNAKGGNSHRNPKLLNVLGVGDTLGAGDSKLVLDILPKDLAMVAFENMRKEVAWNSMYHRGGEVPRLVAVEGHIHDDGR